MTDTYFGDVLGSWNNGVQLDLRVKLAIEFLKAHPAQGPATEAAGYALDLADALIAESTTRGLMKDLPEDDELTQPMRRHIRRQMRAQIYGQVAGQKIAAEEQPSVQSVGNGRLPPIHQ